MNNNWEEERIAMGDDMASEIPKAKDWFTQTELDFISKQISETEKRIAEKIIGDIDQVTVNHIQYLNVDNEKERRGLISKDFTVQLLRDKYIK